MELFANAIQGLSVGALAFCAGAVFVAAVIRGFTGFGSSLMWVPSLSLVLPPVAVVPITFLLEAAASMHLLPSVRKQSDWPSLWRIWLGAAVGVPAGLYIISVVPADVTRAAVAVTVIAAASLLWRGVRLKAVFNGAQVTLVGGAAGLLTGSVGIPGPPVFLYFLSAPLDIAVSRASIITFLLGAGVLGSIFAAVQGLLGVDSLVRAAMLLPLVLGGNYLGAHAFGRADPERARRGALVVLMTIGAVLLGRVIYTAG
ncbi:MAG: sulfite exporter TauE/SafE family protein [Alphaproteobacteria bacterium]|nr:sulfite exporter TauE/SafE family protein [Alphaproteobacteria bacterium]